MTPVLLGWESQSHIVHDAQKKKRYMQQSVENTYYIYTYIEIYTVKEWHLIVDWLQREGKKSAWCSL